MGKTTTPPQAPKEPVAKVILTLEAAGGRRAVGDMLPGREYEHGVTEALRLVKSKGFTPVGITADALETAAASHAAALTAYAAALDAYNAAQAATTTPEG